MSFLTLKFISNFRKSLVSASMILIPSSVKSLTLRMVRRTFDDWHRRPVMILNFFQFTYLIYRAQRFWVTTASSRLVFHLNYYLGQKLWWVFQSYPCWCFNFSLFRQHLRASDPSPTATLSKLFTLATAAWTSLRSVFWCSRINEAETSSE